MRRDPIEGVQIRHIVHAENLLARRLRGLGAGDEKLEPRRDQLVFDGPEALRSLWMALAHLMQKALGVRDESDGHGSGAR